MSKAVRVLHVTTHDEECGIAKYQEQFIRAMEPLAEIKNTIFPYSPNKTKIMSREEFRPVLTEFSRQLRDFDILHVQHEFSFYSDNEFDLMIDEAKRQGKKVIITVHTVLDAGFPSTQLSSIHPAKVIHFLRTQRLARFLHSVHVIPMQKADLVITHNTVVKRSLIKRGIAKQRIKLITMPVPVVSFKSKSTLLTKKLNRKAGDVLFCTVGFLARVKGTEQAIMALKHLPANYKLAIIGGAHPSGANDAFITEMEELIKKEGLSDRAYMTGYIKDDDKLNSLIRECEICIYPYDRVYYAGVTSAALNNALANYRAAVAYPTESIKEMNNVMPVVALTESFDYHALARTLKSLDIAEYSDRSERYAKTFSYDNEARNLVGIYHQLVS